jgi:hypothetical protein
MGKVVITEEQLAKSALRYRKEILMMPVFSLRENFLKYVTLRTGIRYAETVGQMSGSAELGPYDETYKEDNDVSIKPRTLYTYLGDVVKPFSPNSVYQSLYGSAITKGEGLKNTDITRQVLNFLSKQVGEKLFDHQWNAVRNATGHKTVDLFDGYDTITKKEITDGNISVANGNLIDVDPSTIDATNAVDTLKTIYRAADPHLRVTKTEMFVTPSIYDAYCDDYKQTTGNIAYNKEFDQTFVEGSQNRCAIIPVENKAGSPYITLSTKKNMLAGVNQESEDESVAVHQFDAFVLTFVMTMFYGVQFESISKERLLIAGKVSA